MKTNLVLRLVILSFFVSLPLLTPAQVNSWTKPGSGSWEELFWSLGVLPNSTHAQIMLTNSGWKAVAIGRATATNYPATLNLQRLTVSSPVDSRNTLMLNFSGREWPLRIALGFDLAFDSTCIILDSGMHVGGAMNIDGSVVHSDFSEVTTSSLSIGNHIDSSGSEYNLTNGTLTVSNRLFLGPLAFGTFRQHGGSNRVSELRVGFGLYQLPGGHFAAGTLKLGSIYSLFEQSAGDVSISNSLVLGENDGTFIWHNNLWGRYVLSNGTLRAANLRVGTPNNAWGTGGGEGDFIQYGGSNLTTTLHVGAGGTNNTFRVNYTLMDGFLRTSATTVGPGYDVAFSQSGGLHFVDGPLHVDGSFDSNFSWVGTQYGLSGGTLRSRSVTVSKALFFHIDGTNDVAGDLVLTPTAQFPRKAEYSLLAGRLSTSNTLVRSQRPWGFRHNGGTHQVNRLLELTGQAGYGDGFLIYEFNGGHLAAPDIRISEGIFGHVGGTVSNPGTITLAGGEWQDLTVGLTRLGVLRLEDASKESSIALFGNSFVLRFLPSASATWAPNARLIVKFWRGSTNGGGNHQIIFGDNNTGLTRQQVDKIRFRDPAGLPSGEYPVRILSTGEIVPEMPATLAVMRSGGNRMLQWPSGYTLQTATNISGPFSDITTPSPYTIQPGADLRRYFRLRR